MDYCDIEWFALETNRDHSVVFEIASKYCISDSFVDHDGHSISSEGFLPAVVDIMVEKVVVEKVGLKLYSSRKCWLKAQHSENRSWHPVLSLHDK